MKAKLPKGCTKREAWEDIYSGLRDRLRSSAWLAKGAVEGITKGESDTLSAIASARAFLDECERHAIAIDLHGEEPPDD